MQESIWDLLQEVNWMLIVLTLLAGGVLSIIGDRVGMKFAKRRVTILNIRPRYTSSILTACTGMLISFVVIVIFAVVSESVRTSLFTMQFIQRQIVDLSKQLQESKNEQQMSRLLILEAQQQLEHKEAELKKRETMLSELQKRADELRLTTETMQAEHDSLVKERAVLEEDVKNTRQNLGRLQEGRIIVFSDERLGQEVVPEGTVTEEAARKVFERLRERLRYEVAYRSNAVPSSVDIREDSESFETAMKRILAYDSRKVIRAEAMQNVAAGESVQIRYQVFESILVFTEGEHLASRGVRTRLTMDQAEYLLSAMFRELNHTSRTGGVLDDPRTGMVGGIAANDFYEGVENLAKAPLPVLVTLKATRDIYSEGPVSVKVVVMGNADLEDLDPRDEYVAAEEEKADVPDPGSAGGDGHASEP